MKIAVTSDEVYPVNLFVIDWLKDKGHEVILCGALQSNQDASWVASAKEASELIHNQKADEGIFFCWTGTGVSIVANRFTNIRAALCADAKTANAARIWNHANVLVLSNRSLSIDIAKEMLTAWFEPFDPTQGLGCIKELELLK